MTMGKMHRRWAAALLAGGIVVLAGCSGSEREEEPAETEDMATESAPPARTEPVPPPAAPAPDPTENSADAAANLTAVPPEEPIAADAQMIDDAEATGMTARLSREEAAAEGEAPVPATTE